MHCEDMGAPELMLSRGSRGSRGTNECGLSIGRAQCNSARSTMISMSLSDSVRRDDTTRPRIRHSPI
jgi:hypothetical protein